MKEATLFESYEKLENEEAKKNPVKWATIMAKRKKYLDQYKSLMKSELFSVKKPNDPGKP